MKRRRAEIERETSETQIRGRVNLDGSGEARVSTGIGFLDHMLVLFARHALVDLELGCRGDLEVDAHHTVEDCGLVLGQLVSKALGEKSGIRRYGFAYGAGQGGQGEAYVPMDECLARCVIDFSGRPILVWRGMEGLAYKRVSVAEKGQDMSSAFRFGLAREFFQAFANEGRCNLHLELLYGEEPHHIVEGLFKAFGRAAGTACQIDPRLGGRIPSTKGRL